MLTELSINEHITLQINYAKILADLVNSKYSFPGVPHTVHISGRFIGGQTSKYLTNLDVRAVYEHIVSYDSYLFNNIEF